MARQRTVILAVAGGVAAVVALGVVAWKSRGFGFGATASRALDCKDRSCATERALAFERAAREQRAEHRALAEAFTGALARDDCDAAIEIGGALARMHVESSDVSHALAYCDTRPKRVPIPPPAPPSGAVARLERSACEGECPVYIVSVDADGHVEFSGRNWVAWTGVRSWRLAPNEVAELFALFDRMSFDAMPAATSEHRIDFAGAKLSLTRAGTTKSVDDDSSCATDESRRMGICYLADRFDEIARTRQAVHGGP
jgi:hypothetical protein